MAVNNHITATRSFRVAFDGGPPPLGPDHQRGSIGGRNRVVADQPPFVIQPPGMKPKTPIGRRRGVGSEPVPLPFFNLRLPSAPPVRTVTVLLAHIVNAYQRAAGVRIEALQPFRLSTTIPRAQGRGVAPPRPGGFPPSPRPPAIPLPNPPIVVRNTRTGRMQRFQPGQPNQQLEFGSTGGRNPRGQFNPRGPQSPAGPGGRIVTRTQLRVPASGSGAAGRALLQAISAGNPVGIAANFGLLFGLESIQIERESLRGIPPDPAITDYIAAQLAREGLAIGPSGAIVPLGLVEPIEDC